MEAEDIAPAVKKQVSEKVLANLAKAQARRRELYEQKLAERQATKEETKKSRKVDRLRKQLVELVGEELPEPIEEEMPVEVEIKKVQAPPPVEKKSAPVQYVPQKPVKERRPPPPPPPQRPVIDFF